MPIYCFRCEKCGKEFEELRRMKNQADPAACSCGGGGLSVITSPPTAIFTDPRGTSKWDNFEYRAGFNMEKAKKERRDAEMINRQGNPYEEMMGDFDRKGVFDEGGVDIGPDENPGLTIPT